MFYLFMIDIKDSFLSVLIVHLEIDAILKEFYFDFNLLSVSDILRRNDFKSH